MINIFVVEDDKNIREIEEYALKNTGYKVEGFKNAKSFHKRLQEKTPDLVLLDIMLPDEDGLTILQKIRKNPTTKKIPVIMVTAKTSEIDKVKGLDMGADDYMTKPFAVEELLARIRLVLRKRQAAGPEHDSGNEHIQQIRGLVLDEAAHTVKYQGKEISLTNKEFQLLRELMINRNIVLSRETILSNVWGYDYVGETNVVDVYIRFLRQKIDDAVGEKFILTVRGVGYVMKDE